MKPIGVDRLRVTCWFDSVVDPVLLSWARHFDSQGEQYDLRQGCGKRWALFRREAADLDLDDIRERCAW